MCTLSLIIALFATTALYHMFAGPYPSPLQVAHTLPRITTPIHQQLLLEYPLIVRNPLNESQSIAVEQVGQGEIVEKQRPLKRYIWRNLILRRCTDPRCDPYKK